MIYSRLYTRYGDHLGYAYSDRRKAVTSIYDTWYIFSSVKGGEFPLPRPD